MTTTKVDLSVEIAGVKFTTCVYNASGPRCGAAEAMEKIAQSKAGAVLTKSATLEAQTGNPTPRIFHGEIASFNSEGLPNKGIDYYISNETVNQVFPNSAGTTDKPYIVSLSGKTMNDNMEMLNRIAKSNAPIAAVELNLACPNVIGKPIVAYDVSQVKDSLERIRKSSLKSLPPLGVKLAPYLDMVLLEEIAAVISSYSDVVQYVVTVNTVGNTLPIDGTSSAESPYIRANGGLAGMSGPAIVPIALANVWKLKQLLSIPIIGVGGIQTGQDVYNMLLAGASACQVGTAHWTEGPECFDRIVKELEEIMQSKGRSDVASVVGALKPWSAANRPVKPTSSSKATTTGSASGDQGFYQVVSIVLAVLVAILLADKYKITG